jgi:hypothetical protein
MHIITNLYFRISPNFIFKSNFIIYMHKKIFASYITIHLIPKNKFKMLFNLFMKVDNLFCFVLSCWNFQSQTISCNAIDIFENLTLSRGALTWVENFWSHNAKVIDYWTIFLVNIYKTINKIVFKSKEVFGVMLENSC